MNRRLVVVVLTLVAALVLPICALSGCDDTTVTTVPAVTVPSTDATVEYLEVQPVDLSAITNLKNADLTDSEKQVLARAELRGGEHAG